MSVLIPRIDLQRLLVFGDGLLEIARVFGQITGPRMRVII